MTYYFDTFPTPAGLFSVAVNDGGALVGTAFGAVSVLRKRLLKCHLLSDIHSVNEETKCHLIGDVRRIREVRQQIEDYFAGKRQNFELILAPNGTPFQQTVWSALQRIPFGKTVSYGALAKTIKRPNAARAVGRANGTNPICLIVPCHRVIGSDGSLTGFAFGEKIKQTLLEHEGALPRSRHTPRGAHKAGQLARARA